MTFTARKGNNVVEFFREMCLSMKEVRVIWKPPVLILLNFGDNDDDGG